MCPGHIIDLFCIWLSNAVPLCENYTKLYLDVKHLEKELNRGLFGGPIFQKKVPSLHKKKSFLANIECRPKFLEYAQVSNISW